MVLIRYFVIMLLCLHVSLFAKNMDKIRISPLPMADPTQTTKIFSQFIRHVSKITEKDVEMVYYKKYDEILNSLNKNYLDIAYLGPLPFATIRLQNPNIIPIVGFYEDVGLKGYTCSLVHASFDDIDLKNLANKTIALTQPLSTCGYFMASQLLKEIDPSLSIENMKYRYLGTHTGVAQSVIKGDFLLGSLKDSVAAKYSNVGLTIVKNSNLLPSFILVVNENTLNKKMITKLKKGLLSTPQEIYGTWGDKISHGMFEVTKDDFKEVIDALRQMNIPKKGNF